RSPDLFADPPVRLDQVGARVPVAQVQDLAEVFAEAGAEVVAGERPPPVAEIGLSGRTVAGHRRSSHLSLPAGGRSSTNVRSFSPAISRASQRSKPGAGAASMTAYAIACSLGRPKVSCRRRARA